MKLTKHEHACLLLELDGKKAVIDPGVYASSLGTLTDVVAIVVTHEHPDHLDAEAVKRIIMANPDAHILAHETLSDTFNGLPFHASAPGLGYHAAPFHFEFFGGTHAEVHPTIPLVANVGVMVNDTLYYPGDSFAVPHKLVPVLALPTDAPWLKFREYVDFMTEIKPETAFSTHDFFASDEGHALIDRMSSRFAKNVGTEYRRLKVGETIEI